MKFIADSNVGRLARWLRIAGFDTLFFKGIDDNRLVRTALNEGRVLLTRDTHIMERRVVANGRLKVVLVKEDKVEAQLRQVVRGLGIVGEMRPFSLCVECNQPLVQRDREEVEAVVPPYVFRTQTQFMQCLDCQRVYWRGTHWDRMTRELEEIAGAG